jgi:hypothetical protein
VMRWKHLIRRREAATPSLIAWLGEGIGEPSLFG